LCQSRQASFERAAIGVAKRVKPFGPAFPFFARRPGNILTRAGKRELRGTAWRARQDCAWHRPTAQPEIRRRTRRKETVGHASEPRPMKASGVEAVYIASDALPYRSVSFETSSCPRPPLSSQDTVRRLDRNDLFLRRAPRCASKPRRRGTTSRRHVRRSHKRLWSYDAPVNRRTAPCLAGSGPGASRMATPPSTAS